MGCKSSNPIEGMNRNPGPPCYSGSDRRREIHYGFLREEIASAFFTDLENNLKLDVDEFIKKYVEINDSFRFHIAMSISSGGEESVRMFIENAFEQQKRNFGNPKPKKEKEEKTGNDEIPDELEKAVKEEKKPTIEVQDGSSPATMDIKQLKEGRKTYALINELTEQLNKKVDKKF